MAGIAITTNFDIKTGLPLDSRNVKADTTARDAIPLLERYIGLFVYVIADEILYYLKTGITDSDWEEFSGSGGGGASIVIGSVGAPQVVSSEIDLTLAAGAGDILVFVESSGGDVPIGLADIVNGTPVAGQKVRIFGTSDTDTVSITDGNNGPITFTNKKIGVYVYDGSGYVEESRN